MRDGEDGVATAVCFVFCLTSESFAWAPCSNGCVTTPDQSPNSSGFDFICVTLVKLGISISHDSQRRAPFKL